MSSAAPEADASYYAPYAYLRPYYASGYAGPLPGRSYQAVSRLHKREAEADPQLLLNSPLLYNSPLAYNTPLAYANAPVVSHLNAPVVTSVVEAPAVVSHAIHAAPAVYSTAPAAVYAAAPAPVYAAAPAPAVVGLTPHDCVTEAGCALRTALATGAPAARFGSASVYGRKRREAEAEAEADPYFLHGYNAFPYARNAYNAYNAYNGYNAYNALPYNAYNAYNALPYNAYNALPYNYAPYNALPYNYAPLAAAPAVASVEVAAPAVASVEVAAPVVHAAVQVAAPAPYVAAPVVHQAPVVHAVRAPVVETVAKKVCSHNKKMLKRRFLDAMVLVFVSIFLFGRAL